MEKIAFYLTYLLPIIQIILYSYVDHKKFKKRKRYVYSSILLIYFLIPFVISHYSKNKNGCLLPVISMYGAIWLIGICFTTTAHLIYVVFKMIKKKIMKRKPAVQRNDQNP